MSQKILEGLAQFQNNGSGWVFERVVQLDIHIDRYDPLRGSSYIPTPEELALKKAIVNVQNKNDDECFKLALTSALYPVETHTERKSKYVDNAKKLNFQNITFPTPLKDIKTFEKQNSVVVHVLAYEKYVYILRISKENHDKNVILLLISEGEKQHYCWIKDLSRILSSQTSKNGHKT